MIEAIAPEIFGVGAVEVEPAGAGEIDCAVGALALGTTLRFPSRLLIMMLWIVGFLYEKSLRRGDLNGGT